MTFTEIIRLLKMLALFWHRDTWLTHDLTHQRNKFLARIDQRKGR